MQLHFRNQTLLLTSRTVRWVRESRMLCSPLDSRHARQCAGLTQGSVSRRSAECALQVHLRNSAGPAAKRGAGDSRTRLRGSVGGRLRSFEDCLSLTKCHRKRRGRSRNQRILPVNSLPRDSCGITFKTCSELMPKH